MDKELTIMLMENVMKESETRINQMEKELTIIQMELKKFKFAKNIPLFLLINLIHNFLKF